MVAAEAKRPRIYIKNAFKTVYWRFAIFFIGGALAAGIVVAYNDPILVGIVTGTTSGGGTAAASPYVIAMVSIFELSRLRTRPTNFSFQEQPWHPWPATPCQRLARDVHLQRWQYIYLLRYQKFTRHGARWPCTEGAPLLY